MKLMLCVLFNYNMGDKIKRLSMNVAFKFNCSKGLSFLALGKIVYLYVGAKSDQQVNIYSFAMRCDRMWPSTQ